MNGLDRSPISSRAVARVVREVLASEGADADSVSVTFYSPQRMRALNRRTFGRDRATDVIAFPMKHGEKLVGDIYVNPAAAHRYAQDHEVGEAEELVRLVVHGTLHLLGFDHPEGSTRVNCRMWRLQEAYVSRLLGVVG